MSKIEKEIIETLKFNNGCLSRDALKNELKEKYNDLSGAIKDLIYFEYLNVDNNNIRLTNKEYKEEIRKTEKYEENYEIVLNKVFTGTYLNQRLAHELINFIVADDGYRYIYILPGGKQTPGFTKYVFHIIHTSNSKYSGEYELVGISEVDTDWNASGYRKNVKDEDTSSPKFRNHTFLEIFDESRAHNYTYRVKKYYKVVDGKNVYILTGYNEASVEFNTDEIVFKLKCNPQHSITYADSEGKTTYSSDRNQYTDLELLYGLIENGEFIAEYNENINLDNLPSEQCFSVINDRTNLEDSMSNQMVYFMMRDKNFLIKYLRYFLGIEDIEDNENFVVSREKNNIDIFIESDRHIIIIENKIDSEIGVYGDKQRLPYDSQLNKYYNYAIRNYSNQQIYYFLLAPDYYNMSQSVLNNDYINGDKYKYKKYSELLNAIKLYEYRPNDGYSVFMFDEFLHSIEYLTWSAAKCSERTALIRLKQRIDELEES